MNRSQPPSPATTSRRSPLARWLWPGLVLLGVAAVALYFMNRHEQDQALLRAHGPELQQNAQLLAYATRRAEPIYQENCASCHGANLKGDRSRGVPDLQDGIWVYDNGTITDIEQTILYGIRSGHPKSHNLAEMPGFGRTGQLTKNEVNDVVDYVLLLSGQPHDAAAVKRGKAVFDNYGVCYDCHSADGYGVSTYGAPALTGRGGSWVYGGDRATLYKSVFDGRHGKCPAWVNKLSFVEIRALAAFVYGRSHRVTVANSPSPSTTPGA